MLRPENLARQFNLSTSCFDLLDSRCGDLINANGQGLGDFAVAQNLYQIVGMLDDAGSNQGFAVYNVASFELSVQAGYVDGDVLDTVEVAEAGELRQTTCQRSLTTLEAYALAATRTGLLTIHAATSGLAVTGCGTTADALALLGRACCRCQVFQFHVCLLYATWRAAFQPSCAGSSPPANLHLLYETRAASLFDTPTALCFSR